MNDRSSPSAYDVAVVGGGFAGSILARILALAGRRVVLLEQARHPRFALGESTTPLGNLALERLGARPGLEDLDTLSSHGRWLRGLPALRRGLKRGFTFRAHRRGEPWRDAVDRRLLVAASPHDEVADTHWLRADVDLHLLRRAEAAGVVVREGLVVRGVEVGDGGVRLRVAEESGPAETVRKETVRKETVRKETVRKETVRTETGRMETVRAACVVDAAGGAALRLLGIGEAPVRVSSALLATHLEGVPARAALAGEDGRIAGAPYPEEAAAVHDLLDEGWVYQLPFDRVPGQPARRSVGLLLRTETLDAERLAADPAAAVAAHIAPYPTLRRQLGAGRPLCPWRFVPRVQRRLARAAGDRWLALPGAFAFADPLFSTGIAWSLVGLERLAADGFDAALAEPSLWHAQLAREADFIERLVAAAYATMGDFEAFCAVASLYFAGASFGEMRARLGSRIDGDDEVGRMPAYGFLGAGDPVIESALDNLHHGIAHGACSLRLRRMLITRLAPRDLVGLDAPSRPNLYPADLQISLDRASRLGVTAVELAAVLPPAGSLQETS